MPYPIAGDESLVRRTVYNNLLRTVNKQISIPLLQKLFSHIEFVKSPPPVTCLLVDMYSDEYIGESKQVMSDLDAVCGYFVDMLMHGDLFEPENLMALISLNYVNPSSAEEFFFAHEIFNPGFFVWIRSFGVKISVARFLEVTDDEHKPTIIRYLESVCIQNQSRLKELYPEFVSNAISEEEITNIMCSSKGLNECSTTLDSVVNDQVEDECTASGVTTENKKKRTSKNAIHKKLRKWRESQEFRYSQEEDGRKWHNVRSDEGYIREWFDYSWRQIRDRMCRWSRATKPYVVHQHRRVYQLQDRWLTRLSSFQDPADASSEAMTM